MDIKWYTWSHSLFSIFPQPWTLKFLFYSHLSLLFFYPQYCHRPLTCKTWQSPYESHTILAVYLIKRKRTYLIHTLSFHIGPPEPDNLPRQTSRNSCTIVHNSTSAYNMLLYLSDNLSIKPYITFTFDRQFYAKQNSVHPKFSVSVQVGVSVCVPVYKKVAGTAGSVGKFSLFKLCILLSFTCEWLCKKL